MGLCYGWWAQRGGVGAGATVGEGVEVLCTVGEGAEVRALVGKDEKT